MVESLLTVAILGLAAGFGAASLTGASAAADRLAAAAAVEEMDRVARLAAMTTGAVVIRADNAAGEVAVVQDDSALARRALPRGFTVHLFLDGDPTPVKGLWVGADGRSEDYRVVIFGPAAHRREWIVRGLTGWTDPVPSTSNAPITP